MLAVLAVWAVSWCASFHHLRTVFCVQLAEGPTRAAALVARGNFPTGDTASSSPMSPSKRTTFGRTRDVRAIRLFAAVCRSLTLFRGVIQTLHVYDAAAKNRFRDPTSVEYRMKEASGDPAAFRRAKSPLNVRVTFAAGPACLPSSPLPSPSPPPPPLLCGQNSRIAEPSGGVAAVTQHGPHPAVASAPVQPQGRVAASVCQSHQRPRAGAAKVHAFILPRLTLWSSFSRFPSLSLFVSPRLYSSGNLTRTLARGADSGRVTASEPLGGKLSSTPSDAGVTSPYARDPWMKWVDGDKLVSPTGVTIKVPARKRATTAPMMMSPIRSRAPASPDASSFLHLPVKHRPFDSTRGVMRAAAAFQDGGDTAHTAGPPPSSSPHSTGGSGGRRPRTRLNDSKKALVARGLMQTRSLLRLEGKRPGAGFFDSGDWEAVIDPQVARTRGSTTGLAAGGASASFSPSLDGGFESESSLVSPEASGRAGTMPSFGASGSVVFPAKKPSAADKEALDALEAFEQSQGLRAAALLPKRDLRSKIKHSGKMASLGFPTEEALDAATKEQLLPAYEAVMASKARAKQAQMEATRREEAAKRAAAAKTTRLELSTQPATRGDRTRLTPRSQRKFTAAGMFSP